MRVHDALGNILVETASSSTSVKGGGPPEEDATLSEIKNSNYEEKKSLNRLPGGKLMGPTENVFHCARRCLKKIFGQAIEDYLSFSTLTKPLVVQEEQESLKFPGLRTVYRKHVIDAYYCERAVGMQVMGKAHEI